MVRRRGGERGLTTLLFTDIVASSEVAVELGDRRWRQLQSRHHAEVRKQLRRHGGREVDTAGDGFFATFGSPAAGVRCAFAIVRSVRELGLDIRAGLHIGEAELTGEKVGGIAVTTAQRVESAASPGQVFATDTIVHLVAGSGLEFTDLGSRELKGVPGHWELFSLDAVDGESIGASLEPDVAAEARDRSSPPETPKGRPPRLLLAGLAVSLVAVSAVAVLVSSDKSHSITPPLTTGPLPTALVGFNDGSGDEAFRVPLVGGGGGGPIVLTGAAAPTAFAWVASAIGNGGLAGPSVSQINRTSGVGVDQFLAARDACLCLAAARGRLWYPITTGEVSPDLGIAPGISVRGQSLKSEPDHEVIVVDKKLTDVGAFVSGAGYLWVASATTDKVYRVDPKTAEVQKFPLRQSADVLVFGDGSLWVLDTLDGKIARVDPLKGQLHPSLTVSGDLHGMAVGGGYIWVTDASANGIQRISEDLGSAPTPMPVGQFGGRPESVAYDDGAILVGFTGGTLAKINPSNQSSPAAIWTHGVGVEVSSITVDQNTVLVAGGPLEGD
jgi:class 3 adenylate cyclase/streptogramin lyase